MIDKIKHILNSLGANEKDIVEYINEVIDYSDDELYEKLTDQEIIDDFEDYIGK